MNPAYEIIHNCIRCKLCGEVIESKSRHDFVTCRCGACSVDGGHDYLRRCFAAPDCYEELSVMKVRADDREENPQSATESNTDKMIDAAAKRILEEHRSAFIELSKGPDA